MIDHAVAYVDGAVHTNGLENFWSLLKRGINGTYVSVEPYHLFRYIDEQAFRFNERELTDAESGSQPLCVRSLGSGLHGMNSSARWRHRNQRCVPPEATAGTRENKVEWGHEVGPLI